MTAVHLLLDWQYGLLGCDTRERTPAAVPLQHAGQVTCAVCRTHPALTGRPPPVPAGVLRTEKAFQEWLRKTALAAGFLYYHTHDSRKSPPGFPDTVLVKDTRLILAELKLSGQHPTPPQQMWLDALAQVTQVHTAVWTPDDLAQVLEVLR